MHMLEANMPCASGNLFLNITKTSFEERPTLVLVVYGQLQLNRICWTNWILCLLFGHCKLVVPLITTSFLLFIRFPLVLMKPVYHRYLGKHQ